MPLKALIFDVDGTLADTEEAHRLAFNTAFRESSLDWNWDRDLYTDLLTVTGGQLRIRHFLHTTHPDFLDRVDVDDWIADLHRRKTAHYVTALNSGGVPLRPGIKRLLLEARDQGMKLAIATTTTPVNVKALLENTLGAPALDWFDAIGAGDCVDNLKPAPDVYLWVLDKLGLPADECLAIEDSANGLRAARGADLKTLVTYCPYTAEHDFNGSMVIANGLGEQGQPALVRDGSGADERVIDVDILHQWHAGC